MTDSQYKLIKYIKKGKTIEQIYKKFGIDYGQLVDMMNEPQINSFVDHTENEIYEKSNVYLTTTGIEAYERYKRERQKRILEWISPIVATIALLKSFWPEIMKLFS